MVSVQKYKDGDLDQIAPKNVFGDKKEFMPSLKKNIQNENCEAFSVMLGEKVIAVLCAAKLHNGVAEVFTLQSDEVLKHPVAFHKAVSNVLSDYEKKHNLHRIQATVLGSFVQGYRWLRLLGFKMEAVLHNYGPQKQEYLLMVRLN